jgi:hypothetical protein
VVFDGPAWNKCTVSVISAARAHIRCVMLQSYESMLKTAKGAPKENVEVLQRVGELWSVDMIMKNMGEVIQSGVLQPAEVCFAQHHHCCIHLAAPLCILFCL